MTEAVHDAGLARKAARWKPVGKQGLKVLDCRQVSRYAQACVLFPLEALGIRKVFGGHICWTANFRTRESDEDGLR